MKRCSVNHFGLWILLGSSACGSHVIDAGELPVVQDAGAAGAAGAASSSGADTGSSLGGALNGNCAIPGLDQYRIVFDSDGGKLERRIYSMRADGTDLQPLTPVGELAREPAVSPDGTQLAYTTPEGVKIMQLASGETQLAVPGADLPMWSRDGSGLLYRLPPAGYYQVTNVPDYPIYIGFQGAISRGEFTLDDSIVLYAYGSVDADTATTQYGVYAYRLAMGPAPTIVPASSTLITHPTLSPDGVWVAAAFDCTGSDRSSLWASPYSVATPACEGHRITRSDSASATNPSWGPGVLIAYERGEPPRDIAIVAADTGDECVLPGLGDDRNPSWYVEPPSEVR
jgi:Tol biopolymer transport system component